MGTNKINYLIITFVFILIGCISESDTTNSNSEGLTDISNEITEITILECPNPVKRDELINFFKELPTEILLDELYLELPETQSGFPGILRETEKEYVLTILNNIRALHGLKPVIYNPEDDIYTKNASLIMTANKVMTHYPGEDLLHYTWEGNIGCRTSNLFIAAISFGPELLYYSDTAQCFMDWIIDYGVPNVGHRRAILNPFMETTSFYRCDENGFSSAALKVKNVLYYEHADLTDTELEFIAYPYLDYPSELVFYPYFVIDVEFSFSLIAEKQEVENNGEEQIDFSEAKISISDELGSNLVVHSVRSEYNKIGLFNVLLWKVEEFKKNTRYIVTIDGVKVNGNIRKYVYYFNII